MAIIKRLNKALIDNKQNFFNDPDFINLKEFYDEMLELGIAQKPTYNLPLLDTIGRRYYQSK